ncbi:DMT family transporter [Isosphaeraceae bacterium EP7]
MPETRPTDRLDALGVAVAVFCCALWGGNAVAARFAIPDIPPIASSAMRFALGVPIIGLFCVWAKEPLWPARKYLPLLMLHSILASLQIGAFNWGTGHGEAGRSSVYINIHPLVVAPLAWAVLGERLGVRGIFGLASAVAGVAVLLSEPLRRGGGMTGDAVVLLAGLVFGVQTIAQKLTFPVIPPTTLLFSQSVLAVPLSAAASLAFERGDSYTFSSTAVWAVVYQGLAVSGLCFTLWMLLLRRYPAGRLATLAFLTPLFGVALGHLLRGEPLTAALMAGGALVGLGIYLVASDRTAHHQPADIGLPGEDAP